MGRIGWAIAVTAALHAGAAWLAWPRVPARLAGQKVVYIEAVLREPPRTAPPSDRAASLPVPAPAAVQPLPPPPPPATPSPPSTPPVNMAAKAPPVDALNAASPGEPAPSDTGYLPFDAVDQAAAPLGDWIIDTDALPRDTTLRVVVQLWISAAGTIDRWEIVGDGADEILARRALSDLDRTSLQPAFLNHIAVPSFRQIEMVVSRE